MPSWTGHSSLTRSEAGNDALRYLALLEGSVRRESCSFSRQPVVMKRSDILPFLLLAPVVGFVVLQALDSPRLTATSQAATLAAGRSTDGLPSEHASPSIPDRSSAEGSLAVTSPSAATDVRDVDDIRRRLELGASGTYIDEILAERDSSLARWPDRVNKPIRVWIADGSQVAGWKADFPDRVRDAFEEWTSLDIPVRFEFVTDSANADVRVAWIDHFDTPISGKTLWARDRSWWIVNATITLALHHNGGDPLDDSAVKAISLHEVGHLLGLDHTLDTSNIMTARVRVRDLSPADRATMELLYTLPPGSVK